MTCRISRLTIVLTLALCVTSLYAQRGGGGGQGRGGGGGGGGGEMMGDPKEYLEDRMAVLEKELGLSGAQAVAIQMLHQEFFDKLAEARSSGDRNAMKDMRRLRDETDAEVITMLTDEQAVKYQEMRKKEMEEMQSRMRSRQRKDEARPPGQ